MMQSPGLIALENSSIRRYTWEDCYGNAVLIPENQRTEDGDSPKEQLASLVNCGADAKGYTLTEYLNDINRENTEVLAEYGADEKVRQAYTYGENGVGERISVDKSDESSYYLYDGRGSVTGLLTETASLTNSYIYDPYGTLTSGTADGVNYYGYNGESTNVKTGFQYLRARYYDAENGVFTTEDSELGTTENPLTRNRYAYTTNNPLNYSDPTGHSLWSRVKSAAKAVVNTAKKVVKAAVNTVKTVAKTVVNGVKTAVKTVARAVTHPKETYQSVRSTVQSGYRQVVSGGTRFVQSVSNGFQSAGKVYSSFKSYVSERTAEIRSEVVRHMCTTTNKITDALGKVDWNSIGKVAVGVGIIGVLGAATVLTGGTAAVIAGGALSGALMGGDTGAVIGGLTGMATGEGFLNGAADGFLWGTIGGAVSGGVGAATSSIASNSAPTILKNPLAKNAIENVADTAVGTVDDLAHGRDVTLSSVALDFGMGMVSSGKGTAEEIHSFTEKTNLTSKEIGAIGEDELKKLGGESQVYFETTKGARFVDQLVDGVAYESKVGYTSKTKRVVSQIEKDRELMDLDKVTSVEWHFFESPVTGKKGASEPLKEMLKENGIDYVEH